MSLHGSSNVTSGFIDLATFDEGEKYMYGGSNSVAYFVRDTVKATWFTQVPVVLSRAAGNPGFDSEWSVCISRAGDYLLSTWLRLTTPEIVLNPAVFSKSNEAPQTETNGVEINGANNMRMRWTRNFMHNLIKECSITFNDLVAARFDNYHLDFWTAFTVPAGKRTGYNNMIGNFSELTLPHEKPFPVAGNSNMPTAYSNRGKIPAFTLNLPLPFFFSRDTGVALPTAALPYNEMRINFSFRNWTDLLEVDDISLVGTGKNPTRPAKSTDILGSPPTLTNVQVWGNYAIVSNDERKRMAAAPRDILIEQVQTCPKSSFLSSVNDRSPRYDIRFSHAIKALFFACRNNTTKCDWSNYTAGSPVPSDFDVDWSAEAMVDPIAQTSLIYENTSRLSQMGSDYFSLVNPWYHAPAIPLETGYHMYSYSLDFICLDPMGSTNYGKLTNVSIVPEASSDAVISATGGWPRIKLPEPNNPNASYLTGFPASGGDFPQTWEFIATAVSNNIIRISGGALGFPVL